MNKIIHVIIVCLAVVLLASCTVDKADRVQHRHRTQSILVPSSSGNPYEVMIVAEDSIWNGYAGKALREVMERPMPMLPQEEPMFHVSHVDHKHYDRITNLFRNIIVLEVSPNSTEAHIGLQRDLFSSPQLIMEVKAPSHRELSSFITEQTQYFLNYLSVEELNRSAAILEEQHNAKFNKAVQEMFGCEIYIPTELMKIKKGENFLWATNDGTNVIQNVCVYSYPYVSEKVFTRKSYIALRDTFMKRNIRGIKPEQYMFTNSEFVKVKNINKQGHYAQEARGLWEMQNDMMGGPFISHSQVDTVNNRVIVAEGFVYAPDKMKRTILRRLEAALYTLKLPTSKTESNEKN